MSPITSLMKLALFLALSSTALGQTVEWRFQGKDCNPAAATTCIIRGYNPGQGEFTQSGICDDSTADFNSDVILPGATEDCWIRGVLSTGACEIDGKAGFSTIERRIEKSTPLGTVEVKEGQWLFGVGCAQGAYMSSQVQISYSF